MTVSESQVPSHPFLTNFVAGSHYGAPHTAKSLTHKTCGGCGSSSDFFHRWWSSIVPFSPPQKNLLIAVPPLTAAKR